MRKATDNMSTVVEALNLISKIERATGLLSIFVVKGSRLS